jgi:hypothetical protein
MSCVADAMRTVPSSRRCTLAAARKREATHEHPAIPQPRVESVVEPVAVQRALIAEQCFDVAAAAQYPQDQDVVTIDAVRNHIVSDYETAHARPQVFVPTTADVRLTREQREAAVIE